MKKILIFIYLSFIFAQNSNNLKPSIQSLILPGWGEASLGSERAKYFYIGEAALWIFYSASVKSEKWYTSDYTAFAELHASVDMQGKPYLFAVNIGHYDNIQEFNQSRESQRKPEEKYYGNAYAWNWDNTENRIRFDEMRIKSALAGKSLRFAIAGMVLNRLISFFDVMYLNRQDNSFNLGSEIYIKEQSLNLMLKFDF